MTKITVDDAKEIIKKEIEWHESQISMPEERQYNAGFISGSG